MDNLPKNTRRLSHELDPGGNIREVKCVKEATQCDEMEKKEGEFTSEKGGCEVLDNTTKTVPEYDIGHKGVHSGVKHREYLP